LDGTGTFGERDDWLAACNPIDIPVEGSGSRTQLHLTAAVDELFAQAPDWNGLAWDWTAKLPAVAGVNFYGACEGDSTWQGGPITPGSPYASDVWVSTNPKSPPADPFSITFKAYAPPGAGDAAAEAAAPAESNRIDSNASLWRVSEVVACLEKTTIGNKTLKTIKDSKVPIYSATAIFTRIALKNPRTGVLGAEKNLAVQGVRKNTGNVYLKYDLNECQAAAILVHEIAHVGGEGEREAYALGVKFANELFQAEPTWTKKSVQLLQELEFIGDIKKNWERLIVSITPNMQKIDAFLNNANTPYNSKGKVFLFGRRRIVEEAKVQTRGVSGLLPFPR